jgi:hypothetical protein
MNMPLTMSISHLNSIGNYIHLKKRDNASIILMNEEIRVKDDKGVYKH